jgi:hypothetical protein
MSEFATNMQQAMDQNFTTLRIDAMIEQVERQMIAAADRIEKRPSLDGCDALKKVSSNGLVQRNKDDSGFQMMQMATGGGSMISAIGDVALDAYGSRKATQARPQDTAKLSPKQQGKVKSDNQADLRLFFAMEQRALQLYSFKSCGVEHVKLDRKADKIFPWEEITKPEFNRKLSAEEQLELAETLKFANTPKSAPMKMAM